MAEEKTLKSVKAIECVEAVALSSGKDVVYADSRELEEAVKGELKAKNLPEELKGEFLVDWDLRLLAYNLGEGKLLWISFKPQPTTAPYWIVFNLRRREELLEELKRAATSRERKGARLREIILRLLGRSREVLGSEYRRV